MFDSNSLLTASALLVAGIVWLVRIEGRTQQLQQLIDVCQADVDDLRKRHEALDERLMSKLSEIEKALARIEGHLEGPRA